MPIYKEVLDTIESELRDLLTNFLESHGVAESLEYVQPNESRIKIGVEIDHALRLREFVIIVQISNKELREWVLADAVTNA